MQTELHKRVAQNFNPLETKVIDTPMTTSVKLDLDKERCTELSLVTSLPHCKKD